MLFVLPKISVIPPIKESPVWECYNSLIVLIECLSERCALCERVSFEFRRGDSRTWFRCTGLSVIKEITKSFNSGQFRVTKTSVYSTSVYCEKARIFSSLVFNLAIQRNTILQLHYCVHFNIKLKSGCERCSCKMEKFYCFGATSPYIYTCNWWHL